MNHTIALASHRYAYATELMIDELDTIIGRILRNDPHLELEAESDLWHVVVDRANGDAVMMRAGRDLCVRFMVAFAERHPEATVLLPEREEGSREPTAASMVGPDSRSGNEPEYSWRVAQPQPLATVTPIRMLEPVDEVG